MIKKLDPILQMNKAPKVAVFMRKENPRWYLWRGYFDFFSPPSSYNKKSSGNKWWKSQRFIIPVCYELCSLSNILQYCCFVRKASKLRLPFVLDAASPFYRCWRWIARLHIAILSWKCIHFCLKHSWCISNATQNTYIFKMYKDSSWIIKYQ